MKRQPPRVLDCQESSEVSSLHPPPLPTVAAWTLTACKNVAMMALRNLVSSACPIVRHGQFRGPSKCGGLFVTGPWLFMQTARFTHKARWQWDPSGCGALPAAGRDWLWLLQRRWDHFDVESSHAICFHKCKQKASKHKEGSLHGEGRRIGR